MVQREKNCKVCCTTTVPMKKYLNPKKYFRFSQLDKMLYTKRWDEMSIKNSFSCFVGVFIYLFIYLQDVIWELVVHTSTLISYYLYVFYISWYIWNVSCKSLDINNPFSQDTHLYHCNDDVKNLITWGATIGMKKVLSDF